MRTYPTPFELLVPARSLREGDLFDPGVPCRVLRPAGARAGDPFVLAETEDGFLPVVHEDELVLVLARAA